MEGEVSFEEPQGEGLLLRMDFGSDARVALPLDCCMAGSLGCRALTPTMQHSRAHRSLLPTHTSPPCIASPSAPTHTDTEPLRRFVTRTSSFSKEDFEQLLRSPGMFAVKDPHLQASACPVGWRAGRWWWWWWW